MTEFPNFPQYVLQLETLRGDEEALELLAAQIRKDIELFGRSASLLEMENDRDGEREYIYPAIVYLVRDFEAFTDPITKQAMANGVNPKFFLQRRDETLAEAMFAYGYYMGMSNSPVTAVEKSVNDNYEPPAEVTDKSDAVCGLCGQIHN